ncbi:MAG: SLC13 family permease [Planctomycetota bacterium]
MAAHDTPTDALARADVLRLAALPAGPIVGVLVYVLLGATDLAHEPRAVAASAVWMAIWWMTEAVPLAATSLLPLVLFPALQVVTMREAAAPYAHPLVGLFFGGFILGLAVERWGLHKRLSLATVLLVGTKPTRLIAGFMLATAVMSMFISNTATALMMLPIAMSVIGLLERMGSTHANFGPALLLGIAYAASIGGTATVTGTQPNILTVGFLREKGVDISWAGWLPFGLTLCGIMLPVTWLLLTRVTLPVRVPAIPGVRGLLREELLGLGRISRGEWTVLAVFVFVAAGWIFRGMIQSALEGAGLTGAATTLDTLGDTGVVMIGAIALFALPVSLKDRAFAMDWQTTKGMPWEVLLLFGGGLSLAAAMKASGLDVWIGQRMGGLEGVPIWLLIGVITLTVVFLTELTSNTATTAALVPVLGSAADGLGVHPLLLMLPAGVVASYAFMLPVATPPNAIVFSSGRLRIQQMAKAGILMNIIGALVISLVVATVADDLLGIDLDAPRTAPAGG